LTLTRSHPALESEKLGTVGKDEHLKQVWSSTTRPSQPTILVVYSPDTPLENKLPFSWSSWENHELNPIKEYWSVS